MPQNPLSASFTLQDIHMRILENHATLKTTAASLSISSNWLRRFFGNYKINGRPLNYITLRKLTPQMAEIQVEHYKEIYNPEYVFLPDITLEKIHTVIRASRGILDAASTLQVEYNHLPRYLQLLEWDNGEVLNYKKMKSITAERAKSFWQDAYSKPLQNSLIVSIKNTTIEAIHLAIRNADTLLEAALQLKLSSKDLKNQLEELPYQGFFLNFERMKAISIEAAKEYWGSNYSIDIKFPMLSLSYKKISTIHQTIIHSVDIADAANKLAVGIQTLKLLLYKMIYKKENLTYEKMRYSISVQMALAYWGHNYYKAVRESYNGINYLSLENIHKAILAHTPVANAAQKLGVDMRAMQDYLARIKYKDTHLTPTELKILTPAKAQEYWRENYSAPLVSWSDNFIWGSRHIRQQQEIEAQSQEVQSQDDQSQEDQSQEDQGLPRKKIKTSSIPFFRNINSSPPLSAPELFNSALAVLPTVPVHNPHSFFQRPVVVATPVTNEASPFQQNNFFAYPASAYPQASYNNAPEPVKRKNIWGYF